MDVFSSSSSQSISTDGAGGALGSGADGGGFAAPEPGVGRGLIEALDPGGSGGGTLFAREGAGGGLTLRLGGAGGTLLERLGIGGGTLMPRCVPDRLGAGKPPGGCIPSRVCCRIGDSPGEDGGAGDDPRFARSLKMS